MHFPSSKSCHMKHLLFCCKINNLPAYLYLTMTVSSEYDCRSKGHEIDPCPVPHFRGDWSSFHWFKKGWCKLQAKVCAGSTGKLLSQAYPGKSMVRLTARLKMTIAVDWDVKPQTKQMNKYPTVKSSVHIQIQILKLLPRSRLICATMSY